MPEKLKAVRMAEVILLKRREIRDLQGNLEIMKKDLMLEMLTSKCRKFTLDGFVFEFHSEDSLSISKMSQFD